MNILKEQLSILLMPTDNCNMNCIYCFNDDRKQCKSKMTIDTLLRFYEITFPNLKYATIIWHGGEPLCMGIDFYRKAIEMQKQYSNVEIKNRIQTNLTLLNDEWISFFEENNFTVGSSFDGTKNDLTRGNSELILSNSKRLHNSGFQTGFISVISSVNIDALVKDYEFFKKQNTNYTLNFYISSPDNAEDKLKLYSDYALEKVKELFDYWLYDTECNIHIRYFELFLDYFFHHRRNVCTLSSCLGHWIGLKHDGEIVPCNRNFPKEFSYGNVYDYNNIGQAFESDGFKNLLTQSIERREKCKSCLAYDMCVGGCNNVALSEGSVSQNGGVHCQIFRGIYEHIERVIECLKQCDSYDNVNPYVKRYFQE